MAHFTLLEVSEYECFVREQWNHRRNGATAATPEQNADPLRQLYIMTVGLAGEAGEVCELLKKHVRDGHLNVDDLALELGDTLYYLTRIAQEFGLTLDEIQKRNIAKLVARRAREAD